MGTARVWSEKNQQPWNRVKNSVWEQGRVESNKKCSLADLLVFFNIGKSCEQKKETVI